MITVLDVLLYVVLLIDMISKGMQVCERVPYLFSIEVHERNTFPVKVGLRAELYRSKTTL